MTNWIKFKELYSYVKGHFKLDLKGIHGVSHWSRVYLNARNLASAERHRDPNIYISDDVLKLFSFLHDHDRWDDFADPMHGPRASYLASSIRGKLFEISDNEFRMLTYAMSYHSCGFITSCDPTVEICWDADRLDLGRVGTKPHPSYLCTETARTDLNFLQHAYLRSRGESIKKL